MNTDVFGGNEMYKKITKKVSIALLMAMTTIMLVACGGKKENDEYMELREYFGIVSLEEHSSCAVIVDNSIVDQGLIIDNQIYIPYDTVRKQLNNHFYVDYNEKLLIYTDPHMNIDSEFETEVYKVAGVEKNFGKLIVTMVGERAYISLDFVSEMGISSVYETFAEPDRIVFKNAISSTVAEATEDSYLKYEPDLMSKRLCDVKEDEKLYVIEETAGFVKVATTSGITGYIKSEIISEYTEEIFEGNTEFVPLEYNHTVRDHKICIGWHQMEFAAGNDSIGEVTTGTTGMNVISPTWYQINDAYGGFYNVSSEKYVTIAHNMGLEVWALVSDFMVNEETGEYYINEVIGSTSTRRALVENLMQEVEINNLDGINIDFERISYANGEAYVQFIRELSIKCREKGVVLSVDMYVPTASSMYYDRTSVGEAADYVIVMGYDEHWAGGGSAGSTASIGFVTDGITNTMMEVEPSRIINAIPFYTRIWQEIPEDLAEEGQEIIEDNIIGNYALDSWAVGMGTAKNTLASHGVTPVWLEEQGQYYGEYKEDGITHRIWLDDSESIALKLSVMDEYNLGGVACWKLGLETTSIWETINDYLQR